MLKARTTTIDGKTVLVLGLSFVNLDRLRAGEPISLQLQELGLGTGEIFIVAGETEQAIAKAIGIDLTALEKLNATHH